MYVKENALIGDINQANHANQGKNWNRMENVMESSKVNKNRSINVKSLSNMKIKS